MVRQVFVAYIYIYIYMYQFITHRETNFFFCVPFSISFILTTTAIYIPPKQSQALLQGGTFVLRDQQTLYAHYDPSTAAHAPISTVLEIAMTT